jgi:uncharacterized protein involved in exopolysaccharide biosynthesis
LNQSPEIGGIAEDIDLRALGRALWRAKKWILGLAAIVGIVTFIGLSLVRALYTSESRILIENDVSPFARAATDQGRDQIQTLDEQAIQSQVQVLTSRDLALRVTKELDLANNPEFAKDTSPNVVARLLGKLGIGYGSDKSELERAADSFEEHLAVYALGKSSVIAVDYTSGDPSLPPRLPIGSPRFTSTGSARQSWARPRTPPPGSARRSMSCAARSPKPRPRSSSSVQATACSKAPTTSPSTLNSFPS